MAAVNVISSRLKAFLQAIKVAVISMMAGLCACHVYALEPMTDEELSEYTGQAFITIDQPDPISQNGNNYSYSRINLGLKIETILNVDELVFGRYNDSRDITGVGADIEMNDIALGTYFNPHDYFEVDYWGNIVYGDDGLPVPDHARFPINPATGQRFTFDDTGAPMPFVAEDPYFEFAFKENNGIRSIEGFRVGFGSAQGALTTNITSLTGNVDVTIEDTAQALATQDPDGIFGTLLRYLGPVLLGDSSISSRADLVQGPNGANPGQILNYRSQYFGIQDGTSLRVDASDVGFGSWFLLWNAIELLAPSEAEATLSCGPFCGGGTIDLYTSGCGLLGIQTCFPISKFQTIDIGPKDPVAGLFLGVQADNVPWRSEVWVPRDINNPISAGQYTQGIINAGKGFYLNIPSGGVNLSLTEAVNNGLPRRTTRYTDAALGLF